MKLKKVILIVLLVLIWAAIIFLIVKPGKKSRKERCHKNKCCGK